LFFVVVYFLLIPSFAFFVFFFFASFLLGHAYYKTKQHQNALESYTEVLNYLPTNEIGDSDVYRWISAQMVFVCLFMSVYV
jgi:hypothetical protein